MARRPPVLPEWATTRYGGYGVEWDEAVSQCRNALYHWAPAGQPRSYTDLARLVTAIPWPEGPHTHYGQQLGRLLGQVAINELDIQEDRPLISALVSGKVDNQPAEGFWSLLNDLGVPVGHAQRDEFWVKELLRCSEVYGRR